MVERIEQGMEKAKTQNDDFYLDSVALNLHGFYSGVERLFEKIAGTIDGFVPENIAGTLTRMSKQVGDENW